MLVTFNPSVNRTNQSSRTQNFGITHNRLYKPGTLKVGEKEVPISAEKIFEAIEADPRKFIAEDGILKDILEEISKNRNRNTQSGSNYAKYIEDGLLASMNRFKSKAYNHYREAQYSGLYSAYNGEIKKIQG